MLREAEDKAEGRRSCSPADYLELLQAKSPPKYRLASLLESFMDSNNSETDSYSAVVSSTYLPPNYAIPCCGPSTVCSDTDDTEESEGRIYDEIGGSAGGGALVRVG